MAENGWTARVAAAAGAAAGTGAAQLGLGYGLGVVVWPTAGTPDNSMWLGSLGWATWITASSTVFGAVLASRFGGFSAPHYRGPWRFALAASAAVGALVAVALIALPARVVPPTDAHSPQLIAGGYAVIGLVLGLAVAYWAVVSRPVAANLITTAVWLWVLAIAAVVVDLAGHRTSATYLTSWQFADSGTGMRHGTIYWPSAALTIGSALLIGVFTALPALRRRDLGIGAATCGIAGPLLVAVAFFVLAPQLTGSLGPLESAYLIAPYAVLAGLAGSALTIALGHATATRRAQRLAPVDTPPAARTVSATETSATKSTQAAISGTTTSTIGAAPAGSPADELAESTPAPAKTMPARSRAKPKTEPRTPTKAAAKPAVAATRKPAPTKASPTGQASSSAPSSGPTMITQPVTPQPVNAQPTAPRPNNPLTAAPQPTRPGSSVPRPTSPSSASGRNEPSTVTPPPSNPTIAAINPKSPNDK